MEQGVSVITRRWRLNTYAEKHPVLNAWISDEPFLSMKCLFVAVSIRATLKIVTLNSYNLIYLLNLYGTLY